MKIPTAGARFDEMLLVGEFESCVMRAPKLSSGSPSFFYTCKLDCCYERVGYYAVLIYVVYMNRGLGKCVNKMARSNLQFPVVAACIFKSVCCMPMASLRLALKVFVKIEIRVSALISRPYAGSCLQTYNLQLHLLALESIQLFPIPILAFSFQFILLKTITYNSHVHESMFYNNL